MTIGFASGCHSIVFAPGYQSTVQSPKWIIGNEGVTVIPRSPENDWQVNVTKLRDVIRRNTKFLILNEPHNPGGIVMSVALQREIINHRHMSRARYSHPVRRGVSAIGARWQHQVADDGELVREGNIRRGDEQAMGGMWDQDQYRLDRMSR